MEHQTYQYFEYSRSHHPSHQERTRAKSAISIPRLRTCCECGAEECPACGRSSSPSKSNRPSYQEFFIPKQYSNPTKSTTHDSYRTYESQRDQDTLFSFPAGRPNPDETYFDKSINDTEPREKRKFSNIERYKAASPVMKRSLQSHISDILGYEDNDSREGSPRKEKYSKDIFAQGCPPGIYRADGGRTAASLSPQPKAKIPWQRLTKQDLSPEKSPKRLVRMRSSPQKSGSMKRLEITQEMKWNEGKRDVSPNSLSRFQDKIKQASMLLKNSKTKYGDAEGNGYNEFTLQTYVDTKTSKGNGKFVTEHSTQEEESKGPNSQKKGNSKSSSKGEIESNVPGQGQGQVQGDSLMKDILRRYGNANRTKPGSLQQIKTLSRGNSVEGTQVKKKSSRDVGESSNGSILLMTEPEVVSQREEQLMRKMNENNARNLPATPFQAEQEGVQGRVNVQECVDGEGKQAARKKSPLVKASSQSAMGRDKEEVQVQLNKKATSLKDSAFGGDKEGDFRSKNALIEPLNYREKRLERQNSERRQLTRDGSQASLKREKSIEALQTKEGLRKVSISPYQAEQEQVVSAVGHVKPIFNGMPQEDIVESKQHIVKKPSLGKEDMSLLRGGSQEELLNQYQRPPTMKDISVDINIEQGLKRVNTVESVASNEKNFERQNSGNQQYVGREGSHASLRKESSVEAFQMRRKGTGNSSSSNLSVTPFQTEQHDTISSQQENPFLVQNNTPTKYGERSDLGQYSTESKPPISKKSSLVREGSRVSLVRESSVEEFNPDKKSSSGKETERDSKQEDTQVYHSTKRAVPQHHSLRKGGSYGSLASESSNQESVTKKKNSVRSLNTLPVNVNQEPFRTEPDQEESPRVDAGARKSNAMQYVAEMKSPLKGQGNSKEKSPLRKTYSMQEEQMVRESLHRVNSLRETSYAQEITRQPINTINAQNSGLGNMVALVQAPQVMSRDFNEEVSDKETKEKKPVRVNSWTSLQKNPSEPRGDEASNAEEVKVNVNVKNLASISVTDVEPAVPTAVVETRGYKPQEIEDIMRVDSYSVDKKEKDRYNSKAKVNPMMKNGGQESNLNESYSMDKSISYEFSFEENSYDRATHEKSTDYSKMVKDLTGSNLLSRQVSEGYSKPVLVEAAMNRYKAANNVMPKSGNNFLTDESQNQMQSSSPSEFHDRTSSFADMRTDVNQNKKEIDHSKVLRPKAIEVGRFNQPALENINSSKISFSMEPMSGMRVNDEYRKDCRIDYCEIKVVYKDDHRQSMLQNFLSGKMIPSSQGTTQGNMSARSRRDLFKYHK